MVNLECEIAGEIISESRSYMCIINGPQTGRNKITERKSLHYCARVNTHTLEQSLAMLSRWNRCENMQKTQLTSEVNKREKLQMKYICKLHDVKHTKIYMRTDTPNQDNKIWFTCPSVVILYST